MTALHRTIVADAIVRPQLRPYQQAVRDGVIAGWQVHQNMLAVLPTGAGKCLARDTPVLMFDGSVKPVQDVNVGDLLMGPDSQPRKVLTLARGQEMMYKVTPVKGDPYTVNESHILSLKRTATVKDDTRAGEIVNVSVREYLSKSKWWKHIHKGWRAPVDWDEKPIEERLLPPYLLGLWLGDGSSRTVSVTTADREIVDYLQNHANSICHNFREEVISSGNAAKTYHFSNNFVRDGSLLSEFKRLNLITNKHIPDAYKVTSRRVREQVLAGLLDADGFAHEHGYFDVTFKVKRLADDLAFLARSLGFSCYITECRKGCQTGFVGDYYRLSISGDFSQIPFIRKRHVDTVTERKQIKSVLVTGIKVEPVGVDDYYGFEITGDRLFMLGDFTVTHNTVLFSSILADEPGASCAIAHRQELVSQISLSLARNRVRHRIIGPRNVVKMIVRLHMEEVGASYYDPNSRCAVAGVDTLVRRGEQLADWLPTVKLWVTDEAHHITRENKWGTAVQMFPNARGLGVTATPCRADGYGLGRHADGVFDEMVVGPTMRDLIDMGFLTEYRIFAPPSTFHREDVKVSASTGDFNLNDMRKAVAGSSLVAHDEKTITGDIVQHYQKIAPGKLGVTFVPDIAAAEEVAAQFNAAGIPADIITGKTPDDQRYKMMRKFRNRELLQLVSVDVLGEGVDIPAIEVVSMGRPTESYGLYVQQFGRALRLLDGKLHAIIIDHVGNVARHGLPDAIREWSLDRREKRSSGKSDAEAVRTCQACTAVYERFMTACPFCGEPIPKPAERSGPQFVDGDLFELDAATLAQMRTAVEQVDMPADEYRKTLEAKFMPHLGILAALKRHKGRQELVGVLRDLMAHWAGWERHRGLTDSEIYRKFYLTFGSDMMTAQTLKRDDMLTLGERIKADMERNNEPC